MKNTLFSYDEFSVIQYYLLISMPCYLHVVEKEQETAWTKEI